MAIEISQAECDALWQQANPKPKQSEKLGFVKTRKLVPHELGQGYTQRYLWGDIDLTLFNIRFHEDLYVAENGQEEPAEACEFGFNVSGNRNNLRTGESFILWGSGDDQEQIWIAYANDPIIKVDIHLREGDRSQALMSETLAALSVPTRYQIEKLNERFFTTNMITPAMRLALEQILHCPFDGMTQQLYLESKCLELIALKIEQIKDAEKICSNDSPLNADDIERIYAAKDILVERFEQPPSLMELAQLVSLNDYKLKVGFKTVFGTTVFGYLMHHRMGKACQLIQQQHSIARVAAAVGYASPEAFSRTFRRHFGASPKEYQRAKQQGCSLATRLQEKE